MAQALHRAATHSSSLSYVRHVWRLPANEAAAGRAAASVLHAQVGDRALPAILWQISLCMRILAMADAHHQRAHVCTRQSIFRPRTLCPWSSSPSQHVASCGFCSNFTRPQLIMAAIDISDFEKWTFEEKVVRGRQYMSSSSDEFWWSWPAAAPQALYSLLPLARAGTLALPCCESTGGNLQVI